MKEEKFMPDEIKLIELAKGKAERLLKKVNRERAEWKNTTTSFAKLSVAKRELGAIIVRSNAILETFCMSEAEWWRGGARVDMIKDSLGKIDTGLVISKEILTRYSKNKEGK